MMSWKMRTAAAFGLCWLMIFLATGAWSADPDAPQDAKPDAVDAAAPAQPGENTPGEPADAADAPAETNSADKLSLQQEQIAEKFRHLEKVLLRMAELSEATDPTRAALLKQAVKQSGDQLITVQFEQLVDLLRKDQLSRAIENQSNLDTDLRALLELLASENRADRIQSEKARIREYLKRLNVIISQQKDVQGRTENADDPKELSGEQEQLAEKTGDLATEIKENEDAATPGQGNPQSGDAGKDGGQKDPSNKEDDQKKDSQKEPGKEPQPNQSPDDKKDGNKDANKDPSQGDNSEGQPPKDGQQSPSQGKSQTPPQGDNPPSETPNQPQGDQQEQQQQDQQPGENPARKRLEAARQRMKEAQEKLEQAQREGAVEKQEEAIRELEQAKAELEEILRQLREEEIQRMLAMLETRFRKMLQMQREVYDGTVRLDEVPQPQRTHNHEIEASRLSSRETEIVVECDKCLLVLREDGTAVAFPEAVGQMQEDMQQVVLRLARTEVGNITQAIEEDIIAALEEMVEALKKAQKDRENQQQQDQPPSDQEQEPALIDMLAELKMIRALQMRVNSRTDRYSKLIEGEQAENADLLDALQRLAEREQRIHRVTRDLELGKNR